jgi:hypothetical protein
MILTQLVVVVATAAAAAAVTTEVMMIMTVVVTVSKHFTVKCCTVFQRLLRLQDAKQVEAKAAKIKEWVTNKLREVR